MTDALEKSSPQVPTAKPTAIEALAERLQVTSGVLQQTLRATAFSECKTDAEFVAAVIVANTYKLNPLLRELYVFPGKSGGVVPVVPIDGWISLVNRHRDDNGELDHDGVELTENRSETANVSGTKVDSITAKFFIKGKTHPVVVTEYMAECYDGSKQPWKKWPIRMLRHKAYIQGARVAHGFSGIYDEDEAERIRQAQSDLTLPQIQMPQEKVPPAPAAPAAPAAAAEAPQEPAKTTGLTAEQAAQKCSAKHIQNIKALATQAKMQEVDLIEMLDQRGFKSFEDVTVGAYSEVCQQLFRRIEDNAKQPAAEAGKK